jgi:hypothetical protein
MDKNEFLIDLGLTRILKGKVGLNETKIPRKAVTPPKRDKARDTAKKRDF